MTAKIHGRSGHFMMKRREANVKASSLEEWSKQEIIGPVAYAFCLFSLYFVKYMILILWKAL